MTQRTLPTPSDSARVSASAWQRALLGSLPVFAVLAIILALIIYKNPNFTNPTVFLLFLRRAAPLMILAAGQAFVIISGEFDLSMGGLITLIAILSASWLKGDASLTYLVIAAMVGLGLVVGIINGLITTKLGVPSFITTLGMMMILSGLALWWSGGTPKGSLPDNYRMWGRTGIEGVPGINMLPWSVIITLIVGVIACLILHTTSFGKQLYATGGNARAAWFSGVDVDRVRIASFVISALTAVIAGILISGASGVSPDAGKGYEFRAISAVVLGGAALTGGKGAIVPAMAGALTLEALFTLLNLMGYPNPIRDVMQGLIIIAAIAVAAWRSGQFR